jgi:hypothetical protein
LSSVTITRSLPAAATAPHLGPLAGIAVAAGSKQGDETAFDMWSQRRDGRLHARPECGA